MKDVEVDLEILEVLREIKTLLAEIGGGKNDELAQLASELAGNISGLDAKVSGLTAMLGKSAEHKVSVTLDGADGAIQDLVSRVLEEVVIRAKQENILEIV